VSASEQEPPPPHAESAFALNYETAFEMWELLGKDAAQFKRWCEGWKGTVPSKEDREWKVWRVPDAENQCWLGSTIYVPGETKTYYRPVHVITAKVDPESPISGFVEITDYAYEQPTMEWLRIIEFFDSTAYRVYQNATNFIDWAGFTNGKPSVENGAAITFTWGHTEDDPAHFEVQTWEQYFEKWKGRGSFVGIKKEPPKFIAVTPAVAKR
jgi:hypothetical protein